MTEESSEFENDKLESSTADEIVLYTSKNTVVKKFRTFGKWQISKEIAPEFAFDAKHRQSLNQEFEIGFQLDHPNIVRYIDKKVSDDGVPRLILEYVDGSTLRELLDSDTCVSQKEFDSIFGAILSTLSYLHRRQIYHLDVKPENIVVTHKEHIAKLIDFGFAITASNEKTLGTSKKYVAPEFSERTDEISGQTDMYAFAKTMQEFAGRKSISLSKRQKRIIKSALQQDVSQRITADKALALLQKPQRKGLFLVILLVVLVVVGLMFVMLRKEQKTESPQIIHDTVIVEKQQVKDTILNTTIPYVKQQKRENVRKQEEPSETKVAPQRPVANQSEEIIEEIEHAVSVKPQKSEIDSSFCAKRIPYSKPNLNKVKYNEKDSLFILAKEQEYQIHKKQIESKYYPLTVRQGNAKTRITKQYRRINTSEMNHWEIERLVREMNDALRDIDEEYNEKYRPLIDSLKIYQKQRNDAIKTHLKPYYDSGDIDTYNYYSHDFLEKITSK
jgi:serine/threonine protein kinase